MHGKEHPHQKHIFQPSLLIYTNQRREAQVTLTNTTVNPFNSVGLAHEDRQNERVLHGKQATEGNNCQGSYDHRDKHGGETVVPDQTL